MPAQPQYRENLVKNPYVPTVKSVYERVWWNRNKPEWPKKPPESGLTLYQAYAKGAFYNKVAKVYTAQDVASTSPFYAAVESWDSKLYATVYTRFADAAKQGSAMWALNFAERRKALSTLVQLSITAASVVTTFARANRTALAWLAKNRGASMSSVRRSRNLKARRLLLTKDERTRRRVNQEIWLLDQITSTLLAYRYGVLPLMTDIAATTKILSEEYADNVTLKKGLTIPWNGKAKPGYEQSPSWEGRESVLLKAIVSCSNPNLLMSERLGIINPASLIWELTPWSFVLDWWYPVGSFLGNFTALVGLKLESASVTKTRSWTGRMETSIPTILERVDGYALWGKVKVRTPGSLPIPISVPYGTGLSIQRGQNALALIVQQLLPKKR